MILVSTATKEIVFSEHLEKINIHSERKKIMITNSNQSRFSYPIAVYETPKKCEIAFNQLVQAFKNNDLVFIFPRNEDIIEIPMIRNGGAKKLNTNGKTK